MPNLEEYTYPEGGTLRAHVVTPETAGESVTVVGGSSLVTVPGIVLLETERPGVYDTLPGSEWEKMNMTSPTAENTVVAPIDEEEEDGRKGVQRDWRYRHCRAGYDHRFSPNVRSGYPRYG